MNATFIYNGDGMRVKSIMDTSTGTETTYFVGGHYQVVDDGTTQTILKYYYAGAQRIAMRTNGTLTFLLGDHLGSTSLVTDVNGGNPIETRYTAWGEIRYASGLSPTDYTYTGQFSYNIPEGGTADFGLMFYNARWYDSYLNHFTQPDSIVPDPYNPQDWDRYSYARNNPLKYTDPTGHNVDCGIGDQFCSDLKHEMVNSDWQKHLSFKRFISARDAYYYYYNHPDKAIDADLNLDGNDDVAFSYALGSIYSEDVLHKAFQPYGMDIVFDRIDTAKNSGDTNSYWALIFGFGTQEWMDSDEKGGGWGSTTPKILQNGGHTLEVGTLSALGLTKDDGRLALTALKREFGIPHNYHLIIRADGSVLDPQTLKPFANLKDYLP